MNIPGEFEWYAATVKFGEGPFDWCYVEVKGQSPEHALANLRRLVGDKVKINYVEMI